MLWFHPIADAREPLSGALELAPAAIAVQERNRATSLLTTRHPSSLAAAGVCLTDGVR